MKKMKLLKFAMAVLCSVSTLTMISCDDDDDVPALKLNPAQVEIVEGMTDTVSVCGGTAPYTVLSADSAVAVAAEAEGKITVTGVRPGTATITVTDKNALTGELAVTVKAAELNFDPAEVKVAVEAEETVSMTNGKAPYTVKSEDEAIATATEKDGVLTVKGVKAGTTGITVTDSEGRNGTVQVTVE